MNRICYSSWTKLRALNLLRFQSPPITSLPKFQFVRFCSSSSNHTTSNDGIATSINNFNSWSGSDDLNPPASSSHDDNLQEEEDEEDHDRPPPQESQLRPKRTSEGITDRLMRLSLQSPTEFVPTPNADQNRINKFAEEPFPDQRMKRSMRNPFRKGSQVNYDDFKIDRYEDDYFPSRDRGYDGGGGYNRNDNRQFQSHRGPSRDFDDGQPYRRQSGYGGNNNRRPARNFDNEDDEMEDSDNEMEGDDLGGGYNRNNRQFQSHRGPPRDYDDGQSYRRQSGYGGNNNRRPARNFDDEDDHTFQPRYK